MKLTTEAICEYKQAHFLQYGVALTEEEAEEQAAKVFSLMKFIFNSNSNSNSNAKG